MCFIYYFVYFFHMQEKIDYLTKDLVEFSCFLTENSNGHSNKEISPGKLKQAVYSHSFHRLSYLRLYSSKNLNANSEHKRFRYDLV